MVHTIDHHRTVIKLGAWMSLLHSVGFPYEDKVGKYGWAGEDPPPKAFGDMELGWVLGVEVAMTRQLFAAPVLPSNTWHQALLHAWQMAKVDAQNEYPAKPSLQQTHLLLQPDPFSSMSCFCTSPQHQHQARETVVVACVCMA